MAITLHKVTAPSEPIWSKWLEANRSKLPDSAFADPKTRAYPFAWIKGGAGSDSNGRWTSGDMYIHGAGLDAAWAAAQGARSGQKAPQAVIDHLASMRKTMGLNKAKEAVGVGGEMSLSDRACTVKQAYSEAAGAMPMGSMDDYVVEVFDSYVIVSKAGEYFQVPYTIDPATEAVAFGSSSPVDLQYVAVTEALEVKCREVSLSKLPLTELQSWEAA